MGVRVIDDLAYGPGFGLGSERIRTPYDPVPGVVGFSIDRHEKRMKWQAWERERIQRERDALAAEWPPCTRAW